MRSSPSGSLFWRRTSRPYQDRDGLLTALKQRPHLHRVLRNRLETQTHGELHLPCRPCAESLTKRRTGLLACSRIKNGRGIDRVELGVVEDVVEFPPESENALFIAENEIPEQRRIEIASPAASHHIFRSIADIASARKGYARRIEHSINRLIGVREIGITSQIHPLPIGSATTAQEIRTRSGEDGYSEWRSTRK